MEELVKYVEEQKGLKISEIPVVVVGAKSDLEGERQVNKQYGLKLAEKLSAPFFEGSALDGNNVSQVFHSLLERMKSGKYQLKRVENMYKEGKKK